MCKILLRSQAWKGSQVFQGMWNGFVWLCALVIQNKVIRRKRTLRTWSNYNHQLPARHLQEVLLLCQVLLRGKGGVWLLPCSPGLSAFPSSGRLVCCFSTWFICLTPSSAPPCLQSFYVNSFLNVGICFSFYCVCTIPFHCEGMSVHIDSL